LFAEFSRIYVWHASTSVSHQFWLWQKAFVLYCLVCPMVILCFFHWFRFPHWINIWLWVLKPQRPCHNKHPNLFLFLHTSQIPSSHTVTPLIHFATGWCLFLFVEPSIWNIHSQLALWFCPFSLVSNWYSLFSYVHHSRVRLLYFADKNRIRIWLSCRVAQLKFFLQIRKYFNTLFIIESLFTEFRHIVYI